MYKFIPAEEKYFDQMIPLLYETGYYEYAALNNKLNLPAPEFSKKMVLQPFLSYTSVLIDKTNPADEKFVGNCFTRMGIESRSQDICALRHSLDWEN